MIDKNRWEGPLNFNFVELEIVVNQLSNGRRISLSHCVNACLTSNLGRRKIEENEEEDEMMVMIYHLLPSKVSKVNMFRLCT